MPIWIKAHASKLQSLNFTSTIGLLKRCLVDGPDWPVIKDIKEVHGYSTGSNYIYYTRSPYIFESNVSAEENLDIKENSADPGTGYLEIRGFFDSKAVKTGAPRTEDNVPNRNVESSMPIPTRHGLHKLVEVIPEEDEDDDVAAVPTDPTRGAAHVEKGHPAVTDVHTNSEDFGSSSEQTTHESQAIINDQTEHDTIGRSVFARRRGSKTLVPNWSEKGLEQSTLLRSIKV
nr:unnamed protein product [Digitaria exilis]